MGKSHDRGSGHQGQSPALPPSEPQVLIYEMRTGPHDI